MIPLGKAIHAFVLTPALQNGCSSGGSSVVRYDGCSYLNVLQQIHPVYKNAHSTVTTHASYTHMTSIMDGHKGELTAEPTSHVTVLLRQEHTLTPEQETYLTSLSPEIFGHAFIERLVDLQEFKNIHGHCLVPKRYAPNRTLGNWVNKTRQMFRKYQKGEKSSLTPQRIDLLKESGFQFCLGNIHTGSELRKHRGVDAGSNNVICMSPYDLRWMENYQKLKDIYEKNNPSSSSSEKSQRSIDDSVVDREDPKLKQWVLRQRREYQQYHRKEKSSLNSQRIDLLNTIHFTWSPWEEKWNLRMLQLQEFKLKHGHCRVPVQYDGNPSLGRWVSTQRKHYKLYQMGENTSMSQDRIQQLCKIGFVWNYWDFDSEKWQMK